MSRLGHLSTGKSKRFVELFPNINLDHNPASLKCLDPNPEFVVVEFEQDGKTFKLVPDDFSLDVGDWYVVRLPAGLKPGSVRVTITNTGAGRSSEPNTISAEITDPRKER